MEGNGERTPKISAPQRPQVLRKGVRVVANQIDPEPHPEVPYSNPNLTAIQAFKEAFKYLSPATSFPTGFNQMAVYITEYVTIGNTPWQMPESKPESKSASSDYQNTVRNDGKLKRKKQVEPFYVEKTKRKRR